MLQFLGEVPLITGDELAELIGLTAGTSQFSNEPWLHFNDNGRDVYIAKKPFKHSVSWVKLNAVRSNYGARTVTIEDNVYLIRLMKGSNRIITKDLTYGWDSDLVQKSEWNRFIYKVHKGVHTNSENPSTSDMGTLAQYTDEQLHLHFNFGNGTYTLCQEVEYSILKSDMARGYEGVTFYDALETKSTDIDFGWRPVLELVNL